jgi:hypothetical protein
MICDEEWDDSIVIDAEEPSVAAATAEPAPAPAPDQKIDAVLKLLLSLDKRLQALERDVALVKEHVVSEDATDARRRNMLLRRGEAFAFRPDSHQTNINPPTSSRDGGLLSMSLPFLLAHQPMIGRNRGGGGGDTNANV